VEELGADSTIYCNYFCSVEWGKRKVVYTPEGIETGGSTIPHAVHLGHGAFIEAVGPSHKTTDTVSHSAQGSKTKNQFIH
jgi:hypothetical protein